MEISDSEIKHNFLLAEQRDDVSNAGNIHAETIAEALERGLADEYILEAGESEESWPYVQLATRLLINDKYWLHRRTFKTECIALTVEELDEPIIGWVRWTRALTMVVHWTSVPEPSQAMLRLACSLAGVSPVGAAWSLYSLLAEAPEDVQALESVRDLLNDLGHD